jgi:hypothetical protein
MVMQIMSSGNTKLYAALIAVVIVAGGVLAGLYLIQPPPQETEVPFVSVVGEDGTAINVTLTQMLSMAGITRNGSYQNSYGNIRGYGLYTGVKVSDLVDLAGGMAESDYLKVTASDDYAMTFEYGKVYPNSSILAIQGEMVLAYEYNGTMVPEYEDGFRIAFLPEDGYYSNDDANATTDPNPSAAGPQWVSNVVRIEVLETPPEELTALTIYFNDATIPLTLTEIEAMTSISGQGGYKTAGGSIRGPYDITGVAFSTFLDSLPIMPTNYTLIAVAGDNYATEYTKAMVDGELSGYNSTGSPLTLIHSTMVLAYEIDGSPIPEGDGPLRITFINEDGNLTAGSLWAKNVVNITIVEPVSLILNYETTTLSFTLSELKLLTSISGEGGYKTGGGSMRGPYDIAGVAFSTLLSMLPSLPDNYTATAVAGDDYVTEYTKAMMDGELSGYNSTGSPLALIHSTMVLAYEIDGSPIPEGDGPLRITFINEDGNLTAGSLWAKNVVNITIVEVEPILLTLSFNGTTLSFTMFQLKALTSISGQGGYKTSGGSIRGPYDITGVAFSTLLGLLPSLPDNYTLTAVAGDAWVTEYTKAMVDGELRGFTPTGDPLDLIHSTMVLAYEIDGSPIPEGDGPLRITFINEDGNLTAGSLWAKFVINITITEIPVSPSLFSNASSRVVVWNSSNTYLASVKLG